MGRYEHLSDEELKRMKEQTIHSTEVFVDDIDNELDRRKQERKDNFYSMADYIRDNEFRLEDKDVCAVFGCEKKSRWKGVINIQDIQFAACFCSEHIKQVYAPRHRLTSTSYVREEDREEFWGKR